MTLAMDSYSISQEDPTLYLSGRMESPFCSEDQREPPPIDDVVTEATTNKEDSSIDILSITTQLEELCELFESPRREIVATVPVVDSQLETVVSKGKGDLSIQTRRDPPLPILEYPITTTVKAAATTAATATPATTNGRTETRLAKLIWARKWKEAQILLQYGKHGMQDASVESSLPGLGGSMGLPLHLVCTMRPLPPASLVERLVHVYPQACRQQQRTWGLLPLHLVADLSLHKKVRGFKIPKKQARTNACSTIEEGRDGTEVVDVSTYLEASTQALQTSNHLRILQFLIRTYPESIYVRENTNGMLPIHIAASTARSENGIVTPTSAAVLETLLQAAPATKDMLDGYGDTPVALAWRETIFCCYQCGRKGSAPCLCKNRVVVATKYLHPLLREQIQTIAKPTLRVVTTPARSQASSPSSVLQMNSPAHRTIHERQTSWDSEMTVKANNYTKPCTLYPRRQPQIIPEAVTTTQPREIPLKGGKKQHVAPPPTHSVMPQSSSLTNSGDFCQTPPTSPHPCSRQPQPPQQPLTPTKSARGRHFFREPSSSRSLSLPPISRDILLPDPSTAANHPVHVLRGPQQQQPQRHRSQRSTTLLSNHHGTVANDSQNTKSGNLPSHNHPPSPLHVTSTPNHHQQFPRSVMELRPRLATPPETQTWEHFEPTTWLLQPDAASTKENENQTTIMDNSNAHTHFSRIEKGIRNKSVPLILQTDQDIVEKESFSQEPNSKEGSNNIISPKSRNWSLLVCQRHDEGDNGHDFPRMVSQKSPTTENKPTTNSPSPISSRSSPPVGMEDQSSPFVNVDSPGAASTSHQELALVQVLHMAASSPATSATATDSSLSSTSSKPERDRNTTTTTTTTTITHIPPPHPPPTTLKRQLLRLQVRFTELRRPLHSKFPKRPPNPYYQLYVTNGTSVASVYESRPVMKKTEGTWEEAVIDISPNPKPKKHLPRPIMEDDGATAASTISTSSALRSPTVLDHNWRIGFRVVHCHHSTADGKVMDPPDKGNVIGLCRTSLDKLQKEPRQPILHGFQVMGWLEVTYLATMVG